MTLEHCEWTADNWLAARQDLGVCPSVTPTDCGNGQCCALGSDCQQNAAFMGCIVSNNRGQTLTLTALPKTTPPGATSASTASSSTTETPAPAPTTTTQSQTTTPATTSVSTPSTTVAPTTPSPTTVSTSSSSNVVASPSSLSTDVVPSSSSSSTDSVVTSLTTPTTSTFLTSATSSASSTTAPDSTPAPASNVKLGANMSTSQTAALIATPLVTLLVGTIIYWYWRRRKGAGASSQTHSSSLGSRDGPRMAESGLRRWGSSHNSSGAPASVATTDILMADDEHGPLRSHPVTMLGPIPQSPWQDSNGASPSFKSAQSSPDHSDHNNEDNDSTYEGPILAPFGQEYIHGHIRYSQSPMRYVTKLSAPHEADSAEGVIEQSPGPSPKSQESPGSPKDVKESKPHSWSFKKWTRPRDRSTSSVPNAPTTADNDWITPIGWDDWGARRRLSLRQEYAQRERAAEGRERAAESRERAAEDRKRGAEGGENQSTTSTGTDESGGPTMTRA